MPANTIARLGELDTAQRDGGLPTTLAAGSAPDESGVAVLKVRYHGGMHFTAVPQRHCICFQTPQLRIERRMAGRALGQEAPAGSVAICPAGFDCAADTEESIDVFARRDRPGMVRVCRRRGQGARSAAGRVSVRLRPGALQSCLHPGAGERCRLPEWAALLERGCQRLPCQPRCPSHLGVAEPRTRRARQTRARSAQRLCRSSSRRAHRGRCARRHGGAQPLPLLPRVHPIRRPHPTPLRRASALATRARTCPRRAVVIGRDRGSYGFCRSEVTCRVGFGGFTASRSVG